MFHTIKKEEVKQRQTELVSGDESPPEVVVLYWDKNGQTCEAEKAYVKREILSENGRYVSSKYYAMHSHNQLSDLEYAPKSNMMLKPVSPDCFSAYMKYLSTKIRNHYEVARHKNEKI